MPEVTKKYVDMADLLQQFSKPELIDICNELSIQHKGKTSRKLVVAILDDLDNKGLPDDDEMSDDLWEFCDVAGYFDDELEEEDEEPEEDEEEPAEVTIENEPDCFSFADERDPACGRCSLFDLCMTERKTIRKTELKCFGIFYNRHDENCQNCLEAGPCRLIVEADNDAS